MWATFLALIACVASTSPVIDSVLTPNELGTSPHQVFVKIKPQENIPERIYLKVAGTGEYGL